jgi:hypothetical protein
MPTVMNPFDDAGFDLVSMTKGIEVIPNMYGRINQLGLFRNEGITQRSVIFDESNGVLNLLQTQPWGSPGAVNKRGGRKTRSFAIPHIPLDDKIFPNDFQGVRAFDSPDMTETLNGVMNKVLMQMRNKHAITIEHLRMGAVKGIILDADGSTLYNLFTEFGISQEVIDFGLDSDSTDIAAKCRQVLREMEDHLKGEIMSGVHCLCDSTFFDELIIHPNVEKFYEGHVAFLQNAGVGTDPRKGFRFGGITFEEYRGTADDASGNARAFIAEGEAHFFPLGTMDTFVNYFAPADYLETVNTVGRELYAKQVMDPAGRWVDVYTQSNPLPLCRRPALLVKATND